MLQQDRQLQKFFGAAEAAGARVEDFSWVQLETGTEDASGSVIELTYLPTSIARWYDLGQSDWAAQAGWDFKAGKFKE